MQTESIRVGVKAMAFEAEGVLSFDLRPVHGGLLPAVSAGAHADVMLPGGQERSYSLVNQPGETHRYVIAVQREPDSRGGSAFLCDTVRPGDLLHVKPAANSFALHATSSETVLVAGGIGITPLWSMIQQLEVENRPWQLHYAARARRRAAFLEPLSALEEKKPGRVHLAFKEIPDSRLDLRGIVGRVPATAHLYCCGPAPMLKGFEAATADRPSSQVHTEYFASDQAVAKGGFDVVLARQDKTIWVPPDKTILETLLAAGLSVPRSCMEGVCGTCETVVLEGVPDHRDTVLSTRERASNKVMMICRSGCLSERLVLDL